MTDRFDPNHVETEEPPPFFKNWKGWYATVIINLVVLIIVFYIFTQTFK